MGAFSFVTEHWFILLQSVGIIGGLIFSGRAALESTKTRQVQLLIDLTEQHRSLWMCPFENPKLTRVLEAEVDLECFPPTIEEKIFLNLVFLHLASVMEAVKRGSISKPDGMDADVANLLNMPLPLYVWNETMQFRGKHTVKFVESLLSNEVV